MTCETLMVTEWTRFENDYINFHSYNTEKLIETLEALSCKTLTQQVHLLEAQNKIDEIPSLIEPYLEKQDFEISSLDHYGLACAYLLIKDKKSIHHLTIASDMLFVPAKCRLGQLCESAHLCDENLDLAIELYLCAAEKGHSLSAHHLGMIYLNGKKHIQKDLMLCYKYLLQAAKTGYPKAAVALWKLGTEIKFVDSKVKEPCDVPQGIFSSTINTLKSELIPYVWNASNHGDLDAMWITYSQDGFSVLVRKEDTLKILAVKGHYQARISFIETNFENLHSIKSDDSTVIMQWLEEGRVQKDPNYLYLSAKLAKMTSNSTEELQYLREAAKLGHFEALLALIDANEPKEVLDPLVMHFLSKSPLALSRLKKYKNSEPHVLEAVRNDGLALRYASHDLRSNPRIVNEAVLKNKNAIHYFVQNDHHSITEFYVPYMIKHKMYPILTPYDFPRNTMDVTFSFQLEIRSKHEILNQVYVMSLDFEYPQILCLANEYLKIFPEDVFYTCLKREAQFAMDLDTRFLAGAEKLIATCDEDKYAQYRLEVLKNTINNPLATHKYPPSIMASWDFSHKTMTQYVFLLDDIGLENLIKWHKEGYKIASMLLGTYYYQTEDESFFEYYESINNAYTNALIGYWFERRQEYTKAFHYLEFAARLGSGFAQRALALLYYRGIGCDVNDAMAIQWMSRATVSLEPDTRNKAIQDLSDFLQRQKQRSTFLLNRKLHLEGVTLSSYNVGMSYLNGTGVPQDIEEGLKVLEKIALEKDHLMAIKVLFDRTDYPMEKRNIMLHKFLKLDPTQQSVMYPTMKRLFTTEEIHEWYYNRMEVGPFYFEGFPKEIKENRSFVKKTLPLKERVWYSLDQAQRNLFNEVEGSDYDTNSFQSKSLKPSPIKAPKTVMPKEDFVFNVKEFDFGKTSDDFKFYAIPDTVPDKSDVPLDVSFSSALDFSSFGSDLEKSLNFSFSSDHSQQDLQGSFVFSSHEDKDQ